MTEPVSFTRRDVNRALLATAFTMLSEPKGVLKAAGKLWMPLFDFAIAGGGYHGLRQARSALRPGETLVLRREPDNPHDGDAIAVHRGDELMLGYIPRAANTPVARLMDEGRIVRADIVRMLSARRGEDVPDDLVFTSVVSGDPIIRLTIEGAAA